MMIFVVTVSPQRTKSPEIALINTTFQEEIASITRPYGVHSVTTYVEARAPGQHVVRLRGSGVIPYESDPVEWDDGTTYSLRVPMVDLDDLDDLFPSGPVMQEGWTKITHPHLLSYPTVRVIRV